MQKNYQVKVTGTTVPMLRGVIDAFGNAQWFKKHGETFLIWKDAKAAADAAVKKYPGSVAEIVTTLVEIDPRLVKEIKAGLRRTWLNIKDGFLSTTGRIMTCSKEGGRDTLDHLTSIGGLSDEIKALLPRLDRDWLTKLAREAANPNEFNDEIGEAGEQPRYMVRLGHQEVRDWNNARAHDRARIAKNNELTEMELDLKDGLLTKGQIKRARAIKKQIAAKKAARAALAKQEA